MRAFASMHACNAFIFASTSSSNMPSIERLNYFIYSTPALSVLFYSIIERSVLMALVFSCKGMFRKQECGVRSAECGEKFTIIEIKAEFKSELSRITKCINELEIEI